MNNNLKILGIIIIKKKYVQINQYVHHQNHPGHIKINIIKIEDVHLIVMIHMPTRRMNKDIYHIFVVVHVYIIRILKIKLTIV